MIRNDFAVFILSHGRPNDQCTLQMLKSCRYTGKWYIVVDDTDATIQGYVDNFGIDNVIVFDKNYYINSGRFDNGDNKLHANCALYAKRAIEDIAKSYGYKFFMLADDDVKNICIRYEVDGSLRRIAIIDIDRIFTSCIEYIENSNLAGLGFYTGIHYFGGKNSQYFNVEKKRVIPYQLILRNTAVETNWTLWYAEDEVTEYWSYMVGNVWLSIPWIMYDVKPVGDLTSTGGMVDTYSVNSSYELNFNSIKCCPQKIFMRRHRTKGHIVIARNDDISFPKIVSEVYKR